MYDWNGTNYTYYNDSLVLMFNFDNRSSLGENDTHVVDLSGYGNNGTVYGNATPFVVVELIILIDGSVMLFISFSQILYYEYHYNE